MEPFERVVAVVDPGGGDLTVRQAAVVAGRASRVHVLAVADIAAAAQAGFVAAHAATQIREEATRGLDRAVQGQHVESILSIMATCGMYDSAGAWVYNVGLPAKSGVGGGIMGVVNRQIGLAVYSPKLDEKGNSVRGIAACAEIARQLGLHAFEFTNVGSSFVQWLHEGEQASTTST